MSPIETLLAQHHANVGPITGAWTCTCGTQSINGSIHTGDLTSLEERRGQYRRHLADVLQSEGLVEIAAQAIATTIGDWDITDPGAESRTAAQAVIDSLCGTKETP